MSGEAKQTLTNWLSRMATQDNQCLNSLLQTETCEINGNPANNANIDILNVDKIDYCHVEKWYDDETYQNMKSGMNVNSSSHNSFIECAHCFRSLAYVNWLQGDAAGLDIYNKEQFR